MPKPRYTDDPAWADVEPLPQDDGGPNALATIAYTDEYREATSYLRAVMAANEFSERVLQLTAHIINLNPAHYTVWLYRAKCLTATQSDFTTELSTFLNPVSLKFIKNYQIWQHRQFLLTALNSPAGEAEFLAKMFDKDAKNYHVWSYRQWLVKHFALWDDPEELQEVERMLRRDVRNNSAWNHRWFVVFGRTGEEGPEGQDTERPALAGVPEAVWQRELDFAKDALRPSPQNESPWNYLRGLLRHRGRPVSELREFAEEFASVVPEGGKDGEGLVAGQEGQACGLEGQGCEGEQNSEGRETGVVRSSYALDVLADVYAKEEGRQGEARRALEMLAEKYDPIRVNYWNWRKSLLDGGVEAA